MQPNVSVAEAIGHRARFAWLGVLLAATVALLAISSLRDTPPRREVAQQRVQRAEWTQHRCYKARKHAEARETERAERAVREAERAVRDAERAERRARRDAERAQRAQRRARVDVYE